MTPERWAAAQELFEAALARPDEGRAACTEKSTAAALTATAAVSAAAVAHRWRPMKRPAT